MDGTSSSIRSRIRRSISSATRVISSEGKAIGSDAGKRFRPLLLEEEEDVWDVDCGGFDACDPSDWGRFAAASPAEKRERISVGDAALGMRSTTSPRRIDSPREETEVIESSSSLLLFMEL